MYVHIRPWIFLFLYRVGRDALTSNTQSDGLDHKPQRSPRCYYEHWSPLSLMFGRGLLGWGVFPTAPCLPPPASTHPLRSLALRSLQFHRKSQICGFNRSQNWRDEIILYLCFVYGFGVWIWKLAWLFSEKVDQSVHC